MTMRGRTRHIIIPTFGLPLIAAALALLLWATLALPAHAQDAGPPPARDYVSCGHFDTQADAQAALDAGNLDANGVASLDSDGDGYACETRFGEPAAEATVPVSVQALPRTGTAPVAAADTGMLVLAGLAMASVAAALIARQQARR